MSILPVLLASVSLAAAPDPGPDPALRLERDHSRRTVVLTYGPVDVPAGLAYAGELVTISAETTLPVDGWLRSFEIELVDPDGRRVEAPLLHHAGLFAPEKRDLFSPAMERIVAFGQETEAIQLPGELGYRITPDDRVLLLGALYNTSEIAYGSLELRVRLVYADARRDRRHRDVLPLYLDVMPPGNRVYEVPPGPSSRSHDWSPAIDGRVLALGGHLHQYGRHLILEDLTSGDTIWVGEALYDGEELVGVSRKVFGSGFPMHADHVYRITVTYDNPEGEPLPGAMGKIGGVYIPARGQIVPPPDLDSDEYQRDWHAMAHHEHELEHVRAREQRPDAVHH